MPNIDDSVFCNISHIYLTRKYNLLMQDEPLVMNIFRLYRFILPFRQNLLQVCCEQFPVGGGGEVFKWLFLRKVL